MIHAHLQFFFFIFFPEFPKDSQNRRFWANNQTEFLTKWNEKKNYRKQQNDTKWTVKRKSKKQNKRKRREKFQEYKFRAKIKEPKLKERNETQEE